MRVAGHDLKVGFKLTGLDAGCEGSFLEVDVYWRLTGDACAGAPCTVFEGFGSSWLGCVVTDGKCIVAGPGSPFTFIPDGARTGAEVQRVEILRDSTFRPFRIGILIP